MNSTTLNELAKNLSKESLREANIILAVIRGTMDDLSSHGAEYTYRELDKERAKLEHDIYGL